MGGKLVFIREKKDYTVAEFYKKFSGHLPKLVQITHGYHGDIIAETFAKEEVLLIGTVSRQGRVLARIKSPEGSYRLLGLPSSFNETLHIVSQDGKPGGDTNICRVLIEKKLPLDVKFPEDRHIFEGRRRLSTNDLPQMKLIKIFEEIHLLGSKLIDGTLDKEVIIPVPLYMPQLRMSVVTGMKGYSKQHWKHFMEDVEEDSLLVEYDNEYGTQNIGEYKYIEDHPGRMYSYVQPVYFDSVINTFARRPHEAGVKRPLPDPLKAGKMADDGEIRYETLAFEAKSKEKTYEPLSHTNKQVDDSQNVYEDLNWQKSINAEGVTETSPKQTNVMLKDQTFMTDDSNESPLSGEYLVPVSKRPLPDLPERREKTQAAGWKDTYVNKDKTQEAGLKDTHVNKANDATTTNAPISSEYLNQMKYDNKIANTEFNQVVASDRQVIHSSETEQEQMNAPISSERINQMKFNKKADTEFTQALASCIEAIHSSKSEQEARNAHVERVNQRKYDKNVGIEVAQAVASSREVIHISESEQEARKAPIEKVHQKKCEKNVEIEVAQAVASSSRVIHRSDIETIPSSPLGRRAHLFAVRKSIIPEFSVQDITEYLNELNLSAYKDIFVKQMVDGALLQELDVDVLTKEFGMQKVEALRLLKFAKEGHMPKQI